MFEVERSNICKKGAPSGDAPFFVKTMNIYTYADIPFLELL